MLRYGDIAWREDGTPHSPHFADVYYARGDARSEIEHVFMQGCALPKGWMRGGCFTLGETGFGTGMNVLHAWQRFEATAPQDARLHVISVEAFPLSPRDMARALASWQGDEAARLLAQYPLPVPGWHRMQCGRVTLTLGFGDAAALLGDYDAQVDAWFLDGFAPAKNAQMWSNALFDAIAALSHDGTRIASFTAAGAVRRGLEARGFAIERCQGFGHKRHAIRGVFAAPQKRNAAVVAPEQVAVIGAGIAGASVANALAMRGVKVQMYDAAPHAASAASGNPAAVLYPHITQHWGANMAWHLAGFAHAVRQVRDAAFTTQCGMLKTPKDAKDEMRLRAACAAFEPELIRWVEAEEAQGLLGVKPPSGGAWFAASGWVNPRAWCEALLQDVDAYYNASLDTLARDGDGWRLGFTDGSTRYASHVVLANAQDAQRVAAVGAPMFASAGQVSMVPHRDSMGALQAVLCHRGYMVPQAEGTLLGATYDHNDLSLYVSAANHARNAEEAQRALPGCVRADADRAAWQGRTALRASTRDRLPLVGDVAKGLYLSAGHGSRGMVSAPYAAEVIASHICAEPMPIARSLARAVQPLRWVEP